MATTSAAQWLRNLVEAGHIPAGDVDDRSIRDVGAGDLSATAIEGPPEMFAPYEIVWRLAHEDEQDNRHAIRPMHELSILMRNRCATVTDLIEEWADNEMGMWDDADLLKILVLHPPELAGTYHASMAKVARAYVYDKTTEDAADANQ